MKKYISLLLSIVMLFSITSGMSFTAKANPYTGGDANCTYVAWQEMYNRQGVALPWCANAYDWLDEARKAGYSVYTSGNCVAGSIAVWQQGGQHVAYVLSSSGGTMTVIEGNYNGRKNTTTGLSSAVGSLRYNNTQKLAGYFTVKKKDTTKPVVSNVKLTNVTTNGYTIQCTITDNVGVNKVTFPTWYNKDGVSTAKDYTGTKNGNTYTFTFTGATRDGLYTTHIHAWDAAGNYTNYSTFASIKVAKNTKIEVYKSAIYNGKLYASFNQNFDDHETVFSGHFKLAEPKDTATINTLNGLISGGKMTYYLLGIERSGNNWVYRSTKSKVDNSLLNWDTATNDPNNEGGKENYVAIRKSNNKWIDISYNSDSPGFIAETDLSAIKPLKETYYNGHKYVFYNTPMPFAYAELICQAKGGYLASIRDIGENKAIAGMLENGQTAFVGGKRTSSGAFEWVNGESYIELKKWGYGEPNNSSRYGGQNYIHIYQNGEWDDTNDESPNGKVETNGFICEYTPQYEIIVNQANPLEVTKNDVIVLAKYDDGTSIDVSNNAYITITVEKQNSSEYKISVNPAPIANFSVGTYKIVKIEEEHSHNYIEEITKIPTCTEKGIKTFTCSGCSDSFVADVANLEHNYENGVCTGCGKTEIESASNVLYLNSKKEVIVCRGNAEESKNTFVFTAEKDGTYLFYSEGEYDSVISIYDSKEALIKTGDDFNLDSNFRTAIELKAGQSVKVVCSVFDDTDINYAQYYVCVKKHEHNIVEKKQEDDECVDLVLVTRACDDCDKYSYSYEDSKGHILKFRGEKATTEKDGYYEAYCEDCDEIISHTVISRPSKVTLSNTTYTYNGKVKKPSVIVTDSQGVELIKGSDYTVAYSKGRTEIGKYAMKITYKGFYSGSQIVYFKIVPKGTTISKLTKGRKSFTVKWKKQSKQTSGYQIQYSTKKSFKSAKTITVSGTKKTSRKISKLKKKKTYYVRVRTYKTVNKTKYYSSWSKTKSVKTK